MAQFNIGSSTEYIPKPKLIVMQVFVILSKDTNFLFAMSAYNFLFPSEYHDLASVDSRPCNHRDHPRRRPRMDELAMASKA